MGEVQHLGEFGGLVCPSYRFVVFCLALLVFVWHHCTHPTGGTVTRAFVLSCFSPFIEFVSEVVCVFFILVSSLVTSTIMSVAGVTASHFVEAIQ